VEKLVQETLVGAMAVVLMFSVGLELTAERLRHVFREPWTLLRGVVANHVFIPLLAFLVVRWAHFDVGVEVAILLCAASPGGPIGPYLTQQARGNLPVAVSLVVVSNVLNLVLTPLTMTVFVGPTGEAVPTIGMAITVFLFMFLPLWAGIHLRQRQEQLALRILPWVRGVTNLTLVCVMIMLIALHGAEARAFDLRTVVLIEALVIATFAIGSLSVGPGARLATSLTSGIRNLATAFLLAIAWFPDPMTQLGSLLYASCMYVTAVIVTIAFERRGRRSPVDEDSLEEDPLEVAPVAMPNRVPEGPDHSL
jgi:bile acid:Na+ symporter, BASS family